MIFETDGVYRKPVQLMPPLSVQTAVASVNSAITYSKR